VPGDTRFLIGLYNRNVPAGPKYDPAVAYDDMYIWYEYMPFSPGKYFIARSYAITCFIIISVLGGEIGKIEML